MIRAPRDISAKALYTHSGTHYAAPEPAGSFMWLPRCTCGWQGEPSLDKRDCTAQIIEHQGLPFTPSDRSLSATSSALWLSPDCPVARALRLTGIEASVSPSDFSKSGHWDYLDLNRGHFRLPEPVARFAQFFDRYAPTRYPDLIEAS